ncbi:M56 family metallopeptidase [Streptomyces sp. NPDC051211]|uniref:M56 family metallopeptidase n=1 Tax=Streptomyces sp. NPDC051211 TaxID=3154643 RepID=UPI00344B1F2C
MNHHIVPPLVIAACTGLVCPGLLARARWVRQAPRLAIVAWGVLVVAFTTMVALGAMQLILPYDNAHRLANQALTCLPWSGEPCGGTAGATAGGPHGAHGTAVEAVDRVALAAAAAVLALPTAAFCRELLTARRRRVRHARDLRLVGRADRDLRATVVAHGEPAVYCLPGRSAQIVVTTGAMSLLTEAQLAAALRHERAHIAGRHHMVIGGVEAFGRVFRGLPLTRLARAEVPLLLEMTADDHALRHCSRDVLATALYSMAAGQPGDRGAFAAGGPSAAIRIARILDRRRPGCPVLHGLTSVAVTAGLMVPIATSCCFVLS